jgi:hypothetical protein
MTSLTPTPLLLDDSELLRAATAPRARLFPVLNRASAFAPLILVCCVLPGFQLLARPTLNEEGSLWGLRALAVANVTTIAEILEPGINEPSQPLIFQPPLSAWLNGFVIRVLGTSHPLSMSLVSLVATAVAIWLTTRLAWRIGGAHTALVSALLMCCHPQTLEMAITPGNGSIGLCLMLASVFGFQRHLEGRWARVSPSLVTSGFVWGLLVLAVGPVALMIPLLFMLHALNQRSGNQPEFAKPSLRDQLLLSRPVLRSTLFFVALGLVVSAWWGFVIGFHGFESWWTNLPVDCLAERSTGWHNDLRPFLQPTWREWFEQQSLILAWMIVGFERSWHVFRRPGSELIRRRYQLLLLWWLVAFVGRNLAEFLGMITVTNTMVWNLALLGPTILLAALGIGTLIERAVSRRGEFFLVVLLVSLSVARLSMSWLIGRESGRSSNGDEIIASQMSLSWLFGLAGGACAATVLIFGPRLIPSTGRTEHGWSQAAWRQLLQITVYVSLIACLSFGLVLRTSANDDEHRLSNLRDRFKSLPEVRRISLIATRDPIPMTLIYLLRSRWPDAELVTSEGWDAGLTEAMNQESKSPQSRFLILEWTYRDLRFSANSGLEWRTKPAGEPMRFHGRRLSIVLIEPQS